MLTSDKLTVHTIHSQFYHVSVLRFLDSVYLALLSVGFLALIRLYGSGILALVQLLNGGCKRKWLIYSFAKS